MIYRIIYYFFAGISDLIKPFDRRIILYRINKRLPKKDKCDLFNLVSILDSYEKITLPDALRFTILKDGPFNILSACAISPKHILVSQEWASELFLNQEIKNAFIITIGHEKTHLENDFLYKKTINKLDKTFINYVNEVHADFGAAEKMVDSDRHKLILSMEYKLSSKHTDNDSSSHPSWKRRLEYVSDYDFDEILIHRIADDAGCHNETLINEITSYYRPIILK